MLHSLFWGRGGGQGKCLRSYPEKMFISLRSSKSDLTAGRTHAVLTDGICTQSSFCVPIKLSGTCHHHANSKTWKDVLLLDYDSSRTILSICIHPPGSRDHACRRVGIETFYSRKYRSMSTHTHSTLQCFYRPEVSIQLFYYILFK